MALEILGGTGFDFAVPHAAFAPVTGVGGWGDTNASVVELPYGIGRRAYFRAAPDGDSAGVAVATPVSEVWLNAWLYYSSVGNPLWFTFYSTGGLNALMRINATTIDAWRGNQVAYLGGSASFPSIQNALTYVQIRYVPGVLNGVFQVYFNLSGTPVYSVTNVNTADTGVANFNLTSSYCTLFGGNGGYDDVWLTNERPAGHLRTYLLLPGAAGSVEQFATLSGAATQRAAMANATSDGDTSYIADSVAGRSTLVKVASHSIAHRIHAIRPILCSKRMGSAGTIACRFKSGTYDADLNATAVDTSYALMAGGLMNTDPETGLPWQLAKLTQIEWGPKIVSATGGDIRVTQAALEVVGDVSLGDYVPPPPVPTMLREAQFLI